MRAESLDLFEPEARQQLAPGAMLLRGFALDQAPQLLAELTAVLQLAPLRHMVTPGGQRMSVAMRNCGTLGWICVARGYRYAAQDPQTGAAWPAMPAAFLDLAQRAAGEAGYPGFEPDACLMNCYQPGTRLTLHQDRDERDKGHPIVSVSLGLPAVFQFGGARRADRPMRVPLQHGDVVVWGGPSRLNYHGVLPLADGEHALTGARRFNITLRRAG
jgi:alkylated DNA repair protein (DNA oxidative demethylase)